MLTYGVLVITGGHGEARVTPCVQAGVGDGHPPSREDICDVQRSRVMINYSVRNPSLSHVDRFGVLQ